MEVSSASLPAIHVDTSETLFTNTADQTYINTLRTPAVQRTVVPDSSKNFMSPTTASLARRRTAARPAITDNTFAANNLPDDNPACLTDAERALKIESGGKIYQYQGKRSAVGFEKIIGLDGSMSPTLHIMSTWLTQLAVYDDFSDFERKTGLVNIFIAPGRWSKISVTCHVLKPLAFPRVENGLLLNDKLHVTANDNVVLLPAANGRLSQRLVHESGDEGCLEKEFEYDGLVSQINYINRELVQIAELDYWPDPSGCNIYEASGQVDTPWDPNFEPREKPWDLVQEWGGRNYMDGYVIEHLFSQTEGLY